MFWIKEKEKVNYGKIIGITVSIVLGVVALAAIAYKLWEKYSMCLCDSCYDDLLDECCDCELELDEACDCEAEAVADAE